MSRRNIIIAVIIVVLLGAAVGYYFLYYTEEPEQQLTEETTQVSQEQETPDAASALPETEGDTEDEGEEEAQTIEEELAQDVEIELPEKFAYRNEIKNPFGRIQEEQEEPEVTKEELTIPFRLDGIITNGNQQIAIITTQEGSRFISENESIGEFYISNVSDDQIRIRYKYLTVYMKIGGALVE